MCFERKVFPSEMREVQLRRLSNYTLHALSTQFYDIDRYLGVSLSYAT